MPAFLENQNRAMGILIVDCSRITEKASLFDRFDEFFSKLGVRCRQIRDRIGKIGRVSDDKISTWNLPFLFGNIPIEMEYGPLRNCYPSLLILKLKS